MKTGNTHQPYTYSSIRYTPQWSPAMKTGNTRDAAARNQPRTRASMEPGHEDREYRPPPPSSTSESRCLNGARP